MSVPELLIVPPPLTVIVPAAGVKVPVVEKVPATVAVCVPEEIVPLIVKLL